MDFKEVIIITLILLIIGINIVYVSINTLRTILVIKGQRLFASVISVFEVGVYLFGLTIVLKNLDKPVNIIAYCIGYGAGVYIGSLIEQYLALGYVEFQIIVDSVEQDLPRLLREKGYGVTSWNGEGKDGLRLVLRVLAKRSNEKKLMKYLNEIAPSAFVISYEPKNFIGGFWTKNIRKF
ncbi:DUF2179 domain-containing protein [Caproicibacter fermentans]|uniref:UPF0316 protein HCR03_16750 n=1 Tax=Caproicibacter fermentans TaxID=2576756 RepID=A0A7G8T9K7_9FIRM|nr:DUF2179 domain-containing protein [Caproicibacter fermentans]QNK40298.1 DUF2179 domain-containing protein [Caproicibacter fermentans]